MKTLSIIAFFIIASVPVIALGQNDQDLEIKKLKERLDAIEATFPFKGSATWGNKISATLIPIGGMLQEDPLTGFEFTFPVHSVVSIRIDTLLLNDIKHVTRFNGLAINSRRMSKSYGLPSVGIITRSRMLLNMRVYGGYFVGILYDFSNKFKPCLHAKVFGGFEVYFNKFMAFYVELGSGFVFANRHTRDVVDIGTTNLLLVGGFRTYFDFAPRTN